MLIVFVATSEVGSPASVAMAHALAEVLAADLRIDQRTFDHAPDDAAVAAAAQAVGAQAAARVTFVDGLRTRALVHVYLAVGGEAYDRVVIFQPSDPEPERGRTLGFVVASYLLPTLARPPPEVPTAASRPLVTTPPPLTVRPRWELEAYGTGVLPLADAGAGVGGGVGARVHSSPRWGLRVGGRARTGQVDAAQASSLALALSAGGFLRLTSVGSARRLELGLRADALVLYESLTHFSTDDASPVTRGRWLPGASVLLEVAWRVAATAALHLAAGGEAALGETVVYVKNRPVSRLGPWRAVAELGFRARF